MASTSTSRRPLATFFPVSTAPAAVSSSKAGAMKGARSSDHYTRLSIPSPPDVPRPVSTTDDGQENGNTSGGGGEDISVDQHSSAHNSHDDSHDDDDNNDDESPSHSRKRSRPRGRAARRPTKRVRHSDAADITDTLQMVPSNDQAVPVPDPLLALSALTWQSVPGLFGSNTGAVVPTDPKAALEVIGGLAPEALALSPTTRLRRAMMDLSAPSMMLLREFIRHGFGFFDTEEFGRALIHGWFSDLRQGLRFRWVVWSDQRLGFIVCRLWYLFRRPGAEDLKYDRGTWQQALGRPANRMLGKAQDTVECGAYFWATVRGWMAENMYWAALTRSEDIRTGTRIRI